MIAKTLREHSKGGEFYTKTGCQLKDLAAIHRCTMSHKGI